MKISNKVYDTLKLIAQIILPLIATFVASVFEIWGLQHGAEIASTIMAVDTLMGAILAKLSSDYLKNNIDKKEDNK